MGASTFECVGKGGTAAEAFDALLNDARHEHGHGGYSGTIAEKHDFVMIDAAAEREAVISKLKTEYATLTLAHQKKLATAQARVKAKLAKRELLTHEEQELVWARPILNADELANARKRMVERIRRAKLQREGAFEVARAMIDANDRRVDDKWGPAGCIELGKGEWLFFGWASE